MTIEINMRLDEGGRRFTEAQFEQRAQTSVAALGQFGTVLHRVCRLGNDQSRHLVARVHVDDIPGPILFKLAEQFNQECLGVYCTDRQEGHLVGPSADEWGPFDLAKFERFDDTRSASIASSSRQSVCQQFQEGPHE
jgi:hypothetical protein